ncbi:type I-E CRISPR-associated protein Cse2/CasB [Telmatospirillum sp.]|uniref:type I-E CRISPR-associated protein Cse2/CasB n=1 Tax=Telmatospirillum sp. TaxID=2079197 RepID=UPI002845213F|nr:type I-E CRISPR-associated protein Cse2/CasB [Telmatospirillum sp.]MDR3439161.1 type I-E CRISPR-associated protein Cse2/CasB [Telmatospirillum sp.]
MDKEQREALKSLFFAWWAALHDPQNDGRHADRAELARLRRLDLVTAGGQAPAPDIAAAFAIESFRDLWQKTRDALGGIDADQEDSLVIVAATLARIRRNDRAHRATATALGGVTDAERVLKEGRFLRLMRVETAADLFDQARRLTAILRETAPVGDLGLSLFLWRRDPGIRRAWAKAYYYMDRATAQPATAQPATTMPDVIEAGV